MSHSVWSLRGVSAGFSELEGKIFDIDLDIQAGERVALIGEKSSGKFFLFRLLAGLRPHRSGGITVLGHLLRRLEHYEDWDQIIDPEVRQKLGVSLDHHGLLSNVNVREGLETLFRFQMGGVRKGLSDQARIAVERECQRFGVSEVMDRRPFLLSRAELRLASMARAFLLDPKILLLENPTAGIGDLSVERVWNAIAEALRDPSVTTVLSTDDWSLAAYVCPRWIVMEQGRVFFDGPPREYLNSDHYLVEHFRRHLKARRKHEQALQIHLEELVA